LRRLYILIFFFLADSSLSVAQTNREYLNEFSRRQNVLLEYLASKPGTNDIFTAYAKLYLNRDREQVFTFIEKFISEPHHNMFVCHHLIDFYLRFKRELPEHLRNKIRDFYVSNYWMRGDTENHWNLYYYGLLLAAEEWHQETRWFNGKTSRQIISESISWFNQWVETTVTTGQGEYDSPNYTGVHMGSLLSLFDLSKSQEIRMKARMMLDYILADFAVDYLNGMYTGGHSRETHHQVTYAGKDNNGTTIPIGFLYFGNTGFNEHTAQLGFSIIAAVSSYRLPFVIYKIATDRQIPYENREVHRTREKYRYCDSPYDTIYKYSYMTRDYCLSSTQGNTSTVETKIHSWGLSYVSEGSHGKIFFMHPYYSYKDLGKYFPELPKLLLPQINHVRPYMTSPDRWNGGTPWEQMLQYKNTIIVLYDIPADDPFHFINGFFPKSLEVRETDESGWIFCRENNMYAAIKPLKPYIWEEGSYFYRFRSYCRKNGIILEADSKKNYGSFEEFKNNIKTTYLNMEDFEINMRVEYRNSKGSLLSITYDGGHFINNNPVNYREWKTFDSPFLKCERGGKILKICYGNLEEVLNFNDFSITEK